MDFTFTNGTGQQQSLVTEATTRLLNLDLDRFPHDMIVTFSPSVGGDGYAHSTVNGTQITTIIRDDTPNLTGPETAGFTAQEQQRFLQELVVREIGRGLILSMMEPEQEQIADIFDIPVSGWDTGEWDARPIEGIAETFKAAFLPRQDRMFHNRTQIQLNLRLYPKFRAVFRQAMQFGDELVIAEQPVPIQLRTYTTPNIIVPGDDGTVVVDPPFQIRALYVITLGLRARPWSFGSEPGDIRLGYSVLWDGSPEPPHTMFSVWGDETRFARPLVGLFTGDIVPSGPFEVTFATAYHNLRGVVIALPWESRAINNQWNSGVLTTLSAGGTFLSASGLSTPALGVAAHGAPTAQVADTSNIDIINNAYVDDDRFTNNSGLPAGVANEVIQMAWGSGFSLGYAYDSVPTVNGTFAAMYQAPTNPDDVTVPVVDVDGQDVPAGALGLRPGPSGVRAALRPVIGR